MKSLSLVIAVNMTFCTCSLAPKPPNIIVILTDDQGYADLGCQGILDDVRTPNIDKLAEQGVRFTSGYVTAPLCLPSRAGLLTGRYQQRMGVETNDDAPFELNTVPFPERLRQAGYRTGMTGKMHVPTKGTKGGDDPSKWGFEEYAMKPGLFGNLRLCTHDAEGNKLPAPARIDVEGYRLDVTSDFAVRFIERNKDNPFFLYVAYLGPHTPLEATEKYLSRFPEVTPPARRYALAMISAIDDGVGRICQTLKKYGIENNTLIFFVSDNGAPYRGKRDLPIDQLELHEWDGSLNNPMLGEKDMLSEGGIRVPWLMSWPGTVPGAQVLDVPVSTLDIAATACALSSIDSGDLDGVNLLPLVTGKVKNIDRNLFWMLVTQTAVRNGKWKLLQTKDFGPFLFDMNELEPEQKNLISQYPEIADRLQKELEKWKLDIGRRGKVRIEQGKVRIEKFDWAEWEPFLYETHFKGID